MSSPGGMVRAAVWPVVVMVPDPARARSAEKLADHLRLPGLHKADDLHLAVALDPKNVHFPACPRNYFRAASRNALRSNRSRSLAIPKWVDKQKQAVDAGVHEPISS